MRFFLLAIAATTLLFSSCATYRTKETPAKDKISYLHQTTQNDESVPWETRKKIVALADPALHQRVGYKKGSSLAYQNSTDCSKFVHEIYSRAKLPYHYRSTRDLKDAPEFEVISEEEALPGDLLLFRGHVGILDFDGKVISATRPHRQLASGKPTAITRQERTNFRSFRGTRLVLRYLKLAPKNQNQD